MNKLFIVIALVFCFGCGSNPVSPSLVSSDSISYRIIGTNITGVVIVDYNTPTNGLVELSTSLLTPFSSGAIAGYSSFGTAQPTLTASVLVSGCVDMQILRNAGIVARRIACGPGTFVVAY